MNENINLDSLFSIKSPKSSQNVENDQLVNLLKSSNQDLAKSNTKLIVQEIKTQAKENNFGPASKLIELIDLKGKERDQVISKLIADLAAESSPSTATLLMDAMNLKKVEIQLFILLAAFELQNRALRKTAEDLIESSKLPDSEKNIMKKRLFNSVS
ncbi:MAG: hypothetical protein WC860_01505 [Candidatus Margulisiibacteriota bacterium]|jgi:hypothetical protein